MVTIYILVASLSSMSFMKASGDGHELLGQVVLAAISDISLGMSISGVSIVMLSSILI